VTQPCAPSLIDITFLGSSQWSRWMSGAASSEGTGGTADSFLGESVSGASEPRAVVRARGEPERRGPPRSRGEPQLQRQGLGRRSDAEERHRVPLQRHGFQRHRRPAPQTWHGVITQHHQSVNLIGPGGAAWETGQGSGEQWARNMLASRSGKIAGGTDEILLNIIGERVLGLPQDPRVDKDVPFRELKVGRVPEGRA
jgi:hypothetical protein